jgi:hypothetical protein
MKNKSEQIPSYLFELIMTNSFDTLSIDNKNEVLRYFTEDEYTELYQANQLIESTKYVSRKQTIKNDLLNRFDETHLKPTRILSFEKSFVWKAASILLLTSTLLLSYSHFNKKIIEHTNTIVNHDTVYIEKETQFAIQQTNEKNIESIPHSTNSLKKKNNSTSRNVKTIEKISIEKMVESNPDIHVVSIHQMQSKPNSSKRTSRQDDSLEMNFQFVSL